MKKQCIGITIAVLSLAFYNKALWAAPAASLEIDARVPYTAMLNGITIYDARLAHSNAGPYRVMVSHLVRAGKNRLEVDLPMTGKGETSDETASLDFFLRVLEKVPNVSDVLVLESALNLPVAPAPSGQPTKRLLRFDFSLSEHFRATLPWDSSPTADLSDADTDAIAGLAKSLVASYQDNDTRKIDDLYRIKDQSMADAMAISADTIKAQRASFILKNLNTPSKMVVPIKESQLRMEQRGPLVAVNRTDGAPLVEVSAGGFKLLANIAVAKIEGKWMIVD